MKNTMYNIHVIESIFLLSFFRDKGKFLPIIMYSIKVVVLVSVIFVHFNHNNEGNCEDLINVTELYANSLSYEYKNEKEARSFVSGREPSKLAESESSIPIFTGFELIIGTISMLISNLFSFLVLNYLGNLALAKDCLLLYLYKDFISLAICMNCWSEILLVLGYTIGGVVKTSASLAKVFSFIGCNFLLLLLLNMNISSALKLYQKKTNLLDPPMPWGDDDCKGIKWIRVISTVFTLILTSTMFGLGIYPTAYYWFSGQEIPSFSKDAMAFPIIWIVLISTSIFTALIGKYYERPIPHPADTNIPRQIDYFHIIFCLLFTLIVILGQSNLFSSSNTWNLWKIHLLVIQVAIPVLTVLKENQLRRYAYNLIKSSLEELFFYQLYLTPTLVCLLMNITLYFIYDVFGI